MLLKIAALLMPSGAVLLVLLVLLLLVLLLLLPVVVQPLQLLVASGTCSCSAEYASSCGSSCRRPERCRQQLWQQLQEA
jgi:hypothetical protein